MEKDKEQKGSVFYRFSVKNSEECDISAVFATGIALFFCAEFGILKK
jgi:hypothetical protein